VDKQAQEIIKLKTSQSSFYPGVLSDSCEINRLKRTTNRGLNPVSILGFFLTVLCSILALDKMNKSQSSFYPGVLSDD